MHMTQHKKTILSFFKTDRLASIANIIGSPPYDVYGISYLLHGPDEYKNPIRRESVRRSLELMVSFGLLTKSSHREVRNGMTCVVCRYGLKSEE